MCRRLSFSGPRIERSFLFPLIYVVKPKIHRSELFRAVGESKVFPLIKIYKDKTFFDNGPSINLMIHCQKFEIPKSNQTVQKLFPNMLKIDFGRVRYHLNHNSVLASRARIAVVSKKKILI